MIAFSCQCGKPFKADAKFVGRVVRCPACRADITIPARKEDVDATQEKTLQPPPVFAQQAIAKTLDGKTDRLQKDYGNHRIIRHHAKGTFWKSSIARDYDLKRDVVLRELLIKGTKNQRAKKRFIAEAKIVARLEHPGVPPVYTFGTDRQDNPYITTKRVHGIPFSKAIEAYRSLPRKSKKRNAAFKELIRCMAAVCHTIGYAHQHGVVHRDLKPEAILLGEHGDTYVSEWGRAKPYGANIDESISDLSSGMMANPQYHNELTPDDTPSPYQSPEQASGNKVLVGPPSDIYSLGVILYVILTGCPPHVGETPQELLHNICTTPCKPPSKIARSVPGGLEAICLKAMTHDKTGRYSSATYMAHDLINWLDNEQVSVQKKSAIEKWVCPQGSVFLYRLLFLLAIILGIAGIIHERAKTTILEDAQTKYRSEITSLRSRLEDMTNRLPIVSPALPTPAPIQPIPEKIGTETLKPNLGPIFLSLLLQKTFRQTYQIIVAPLTRM